MFNLMTPIVGIRKIVSSFRWSHYFRLPTTIGLRARLFHFRRTGTAVGGRGPEPAAFWKAIDDGLDGGPDLGWDTFGPFLNKGRPVIRKHEVFHVCDHRRRRHHTQRTKTLRFTFCQAWSNGFGTQYLGMLLNISSERMPIFCLTHAEGEARCSVGKPSSNLRGSWPTFISASWSLA
jgi:hypothetical protein